MASQGQLPIGLGVSAAPLRAKPLSRSLIAVSHAGNRGSGGASALPAIVSPSTGGTAGSGRPDRRLSPRRVEARRQAALDLAAAIRACGCTVVALAASLGVHHSTVQEWCDPESAVGPQLGDLDAMPLEVVVAYVTAKAGRLGVAVDVGARGEAVARLGEAEAALRGVREAVERAMGGGGR